MTLDWLQNLANLVQDRAGLTIREHDGTALAKEIDALIYKNKFTNRESFFLHLQASATQTSENWRDLLQLVTVGESYFFRDQGQFDLLERKILPELIKLHSLKRELRIWSAACSSGEEAYSLAILIHMLLPSKNQNPPWKIVVLGTDINHAALEKARKAHYGAWSFRRVKESQRDLFFNKHDDSWQLLPTIRDMVHFSYCNLVEDDFPNPGNELHDFDLILCRNVFIYFTEATVKKIANKLAASLRTDGVLITGHGELGLPGVVGLQTKSLDNLVLYQKADANNNDAAIPNGKPLPLCPPVIQVSPKIVTNKPNPKSKLVTLAAPANTKSVNHLEIAKNHADSGQYELAKASCMLAIEQNMHAPEPYVLLAQIAEVLGQREASKTALKKAIYLDSTYLAAYVELVNVYVHEGNIQLAQKMLNNALELAQGLPDQAKIDLCHATNKSDLLALLVEYRNSLRN